MPLFAARALWPARDRVPLLRLGLAAGLGVAPWTLSSANLQAGTFAGGVFGAGAAVILMTISCVWWPERPYTAGMALLLSVTASVAVGGLVFVFASTH